MATLIDYEITLEKILDMCKEQDGIPKIKYIFKTKIISYIDGINKYCIKLGYKDLFDYLRSKGYKTSTDFVLNNNKIISNKELTLNILYELIQIYINKNNKCPKIDDFKYINNLPCWETVSHLLKKNKVSINEFYLHFGREDNPRSQIEFYDEYVLKFKEVFKNIVYINAQDLTGNKYGLPTANWLVNNCPDKTIKTYDQFIAWCGFKPYANVPKNIAINIILEMQSKLNRPICADDFKHPKEGEIGIRTIWRLWGEV